MAVFLGTQNNRQVQTALVPPSAIAEVGSARADVQVTLKAHSREAEVNAHCMDSTNSTHPSSPSSTSSSSPFLIAGQSGFSRPAHRSSACRLSAHALASAAKERLSTALPCIAPVHDSLPVRRRWSPADGEYKGRRDERACRPLTVTSIIIIGQSALLGQPAHASPGTRTHALTFPAHPHRCAAARSASRCHTSSALRCFPLPLPHRRRYQYRTAHPPAPRRSSPPHTRRQHTHRAHNSTAAQRTIHSTATSAAHQLISSPIMTRSVAIAIIQLTHSPRCCCGR